MSLDLPLGKGMGPIPADRKREPAPPLSAHFHDIAQRLIARYPQGRERSALMSLLYLVQSEHGYVSEEGMGAVGRLLGLTRAEVAAVSTFYTMFKRAPQGRWLISVCTQPACTLAGANDVVARVKEELGIQSGHTTEDGAISLEEVECLCACDGAPVVSVNYENYERLSTDEIVEIVRTLRAGGDPPPGVHGEAPQEFSSTNRRLAGAEAPR